LEQTVTAGIISATNRRTGIIRGGFEDFLQTDAAINPGNSGGPLVNLKGEVIGINTAINSRTGTNAGVGFAIPTNMAVQIMNDLQSTGKVVRGFIGAGLDDVTNELSKKLKLPNGVLRGALIRRVLAGGPADRGGLKENDVVVGLGSRTISSSSQLMNEIAQVRPGSTIDLKVYRDGSAKDIRIVVEERTDERLSQLSERTEIEKWGLVLDTLSPAIAQELELPESIQGAVILEIERNKLAARLRLQRYDVIRSIDDKPITNASEAKEAFEKVGKQIKLLIQRGPVEMAIATQVP
jgi:serine protease Do